MTKTVCSHKIQLNPKIFKIGVNIILYKNLETKRIFNWNNKREMNKKISDPH